MIRDYSEKEENDRARAAKSITKPKNNHKGTTDKDGKC